MGKGVLCNIYSVNSLYNGTTQATLLCALLGGSNRLAFAGTESCDSTNFLKTNKGKTCTFQMTRDGTQYFVSEQNNSICLKQGRQDSSCIFRVCNIPDYPPNWYLIKANASGQYLTNNESGKIITRTINKTSRPPIEAIYQFPDVQEVINNNYLSNNSINLMSIETSV